MINIALTGDNRETVKIIKTKVENVKTTNQTIFYFNRGAVLYKDNEVENVETGHSIVWATEYTELTMEGENIFKNNTISTNNSIFMLYPNTKKVYNKWELIFDQNKTAADILELRYYNEFNNTGHIKFINENQANKIWIKWRENKFCRKFNNDRQQSRENTYDRWKLKFRDRWKCRNK